MYGSGGMASRSLEGRSCPSPGDGESRLRLGAHDFRSVKLSIIAISLVRGGAQRLATCEPGLLNGNVPEPAREIPRQHAAGEFEPVSVTGPGHSTVGLAPEAVPAAPTVRDRFLRLWRTER